MSASQEVASADAATGDQQPRAPHTPGPWNVRPERDYDREGSRFIGANIGPDGESLRQHDGGVKNHGIWIAEAKGPDADANARLIAAAPEIFEALVEMVGDHETGGTWRTEGETLAKARAAIAKASGAA